MRAKLYKWLRADRNLDDGRMTEGQGRTVDFKNTIIVMTSNMGQDVIRENLLNKDLTDEIVQQTSNAIMEQMKHRVAPEFINRIDEIVMFLPLTRNEINQIVTLQLSSLKKKLSHQDIQIDFNQAVLDFLTEKSYIPEFGARPVKRVHSFHFEHPSRETRSSSHIGTSAFAARSESL